MINMKILQLEHHLKETVLFTFILEILDSGLITQEDLIQVWNDRTIIYLKILK